jgi:two-component system response regulator RegA
MVMQTPPSTDASSLSYALSLRVLLADPTESAVGPIGTQLGGCGYEVLAVGTASEALSIVSQQRIDLALLELRFDDGDCLGLIGKIRKLNPKSRIVVHTWFADLKATVAVIKAGADDLLPKPLDAEFVVEFLINGDQFDISTLTSIPDVDRVRRTHIETVFRWCNRNLSLASRRLLLNRRSLQRIMQRYRDSA